MIFCTDREMSMYDDLSSGSQQDTEKSRWLYLNCIFPSYML